MGKRRLRPALEIVSDIGALGFDLQHHTAESIAAAVAMLRDVNGPMFDYLVRVLSKYDETPTVYVSHAQRRLILGAIKPECRWVVTDGNVGDVVVAEDAEQPGLILKIRPATEQEQATKAASDDDVWEVWQGRTLVCSAQMKLTEAQARNKVENERRQGYFMEARKAEKGR